jgi:predicted Zn-ribbon and HTH transcriptional regulator
MKCIKCGFWFNDDLTETCPECNENNNLECDEE